MNKYQLFIHINGTFGNEPLSPDNFDTTRLMELLAVVNKFLSDNRKPDETPVTYHPENGSLTAVFTGATETIAKCAVVLGMIASSVPVDDLTPNTALAIEEFQAFSVRHHYDMNISTDFNDDNVNINPKTHYYRSTNLYAEAELYLFGKIISCGGKSKGSIKLETVDGVYIIEADKEILKDWKENHLYKEYGVRVTARQHVYSGAVETGSVRLIEILDYSPSIDDAYLEQKIKRATPHWEGVNVDEYLREIREGFYV